MSGERSSAGDPARTIALLWRGAGAPAGPRRGPRRGLDVDAVVAAAVALPASALVTALLDPAPTLLPAPLFAAPWGSIAAVIAGVALATAGTGLLVARAARRASAGEVLRDAA